MSSTERTVALIVAAGSGSRVGGELPKQFRLVHGKPMLLHSCAVLSAHLSIDAVYIAIGDGQRDMATKCLLDVPAPKPQNPILYHSWQCVIIKMQMMALFYYKRCLS